MLRNGDGAGLLDEAVILLDASGEPCGTAPKSTVHGPDTPLQFEIPVTPAIMHHTPHEAPPPTNADP